MSEPGLRGESRGDWADYCQARSRFFERLERQSVLVRLERALAGDRPSPISPSGHVEPHPTTPGGYTPNR